MQVSVHAQKATVRLTLTEARLHSAPVAKASKNQVIRLRGVRQNNLKGFDLELPLRRLIVFTGVSGSGKSSLAFDTLFAEGQRRYIETFSPYARQFLDRMDKPQVDQITGIPPAIALEQRNAVRTTRSTVGTMTEICDYMKVLWPRLARLHCRGCGCPVQKDTPPLIWESLPADAELLITFDLPRPDALGMKESLELIARQGYRRLLIDEQAVRVEDALDRLETIQPSCLTVIQDRLVRAAPNRARFSQACEQAYHFGKGRLSIHAVAVGHSWVGRFSQHFHCAKCDIEYRDPTPALFSYNHPLGACPDCRGFGRIITIDYGRALPDRSRSLAEGVVRPWQSGQSAECQLDLMKFCRKRGVPTDVPFHELSEDWQRWVLDGDPGYGQDPDHEWPRAWYGVKGYFRWLESKSYKMHVRVLLSRYRAYTPCPQCAGQRFQPESLLYRVVSGHGVGAGQPDAGIERQPKPPGLPGTSLAEFYSFPIREALGWMDRITRDAEWKPSDPVSHALEEVRARLGYLVQAGLGYLTLDRATRTLSGGETQRVNLTTCLGTNLVNTLYVLDEPSVGLHPRDTSRLVEILLGLRDRGNTVVVVEHEAGIIQQADQVVDLGPLQGEQGGQVVFQGTYKRLLQSRGSLTGRYLSGAERMDSHVRRPVDPSTRRLRIFGATLFNLKNLDVEIPLNRFVCVTGVSGSGKSTLVREVLHPLLSALLQKKSAAIPGGSEAEEPMISEAAGGFARLEGWDGLGQVLHVDQTSLGRTPRSNAAVYTGAFEDIRTFFAQAPAARERGLTASTFSFNSVRGQCERCRGAGFEKIEMQFLSDVIIRCPDCGGRRYQPSILEVRVARPSRTQATAREPEPHSSRVRRRSSGADSVSSVTEGGWSIADVLEATVQEVMDFLGDWPENKAAQRAIRSLQLLHDVGLGYLRLGQPITSLSGGESQRLKLAGHLAEFGRVQDRHAKPTLLIFDEPTTGLHFHDIRVLLNVFHRLVESGHSLIVVEHNLDVIRSADWVIDLGPDAGADGGEVVVTGTPEVIAGCKRSQTGRALVLSGKAGGR
jgi:excinuclease ABC subunit A